VRHIRLDDSRVNDRLTTDIAKSVIDVPKAKPSLGVRVRKRHGLIDVRMIYHAKTDKAVLASITGQKGDAVWFPLSQCEYRIVERLVIEVTMPEWLYIEKGFDKKR
jgi:hypothetical protein